MTNIQKKSKHFTLYQIIPFRRLISFILLVDWFLGHPKGVSILKCIFKTIQS